MKWLKWQQGRQESGYSRLQLLGGKWWHILLLKFPVGSFINIHKDEVQDRRHYRLNIVLKKAKKGGNFICDNSIYESDRVKFFRSDITYHAVTKIEEGTRYMLSIGWAIK